MKETELTQEEYEFILLMSAKPLTEEGKRLVAAASAKYSGRINWESLAGTPIAGDDQQKQAVRDLIGTSAVMVA